MSRYDPLYYATKTDKYKALLNESKLDFDNKLAKKQDHLRFWRANYQLWSYLCCMTRDVIPKECDEMACHYRVEKTFAKYSCKVQMMEALTKT